MCYEMTIILTGLLTLGAVALGAWLVGRQQQAQRRARFLEHQLREFYSPLLALLDEIRAKKRLRDRILRTAHEASRVQADELNRLIQHDNKFVAEIYPAYAKMVSVFRDNLWLADPETRGFYPALIEFVRIWERWLDDTMSSELVQAIGHSEEPLQPFFDHLQRKHDELRAKLSQGKV